MKNKKALVLAIVFTLLTSIFAMSDDGASEPVIAKKEVISDVSQVDNPNKTEEVKSIENVKDQFGIDTGMTKVEFELFKNNYFTVAEKLGITNNLWIDIKSYFDHKINLNAVEELKNNGFFWTKDPKHDQRIEYSISHSDIIVIGTIDHSEYLYNTQEEETNASKTYKRLTRYYVKVENLLKGTEYYNSLPEQVTYTSPIGKYVWASSDQKLKIGQKYILFFRKYTNTTNDLYKIRFTSLRLEGFNLYLESSKTKLNLDYTELLHKISQFQEINDSKNFYDRHYLNVGEEE
ncbi:MAG: hypothetical protein PF638_12995 [Candidatus Delongbacteria bacterium]|jgi:hypothetical protein|nr:hypothetical protein [Candidatus Delongbacteria bacterium]